MVKRKRTGFPLAAAEASSTAPAPAHAAATASEFLRGPTAHNQVEELVAAAVALRSWSFESSRGVSGGSCSTQKLEFRILSSHTG